MKYSNNVRTTLKHSLSVMNSLIIITGFILMVGSAGALDYSVEIGSIEDPSGDYRRMILGMIFLIIGFSFAYWRQTNGKRSISTQKWIRKLTLQAWINEHSDPSYLGKHENQVL